MLREIKFESFPYLNRLASYFIFGKQCDAVYKKEDEYGIRIFKTIGMKNAWDYFCLDETGMITQSPRGMAKQFNKKIRITNMDEMVEAYKGKRVNQAF